MNVTHDDTDTCSHQPPFKVSLEHTTPFKVTHNSAVKFIEYLILKVGLKEKGYVCDCIVCAKISPKVNPVNRVDTVCKHGQVRVAAELKLLS